MRTLLVAAALLAGIACSGSRGAPAYDPTAVTMCIENAAAGYGNVVAYVGTTRFTVYPGEEQCKDVRAPGGSLPIRASSTGGGMTGPLRYSFELPGGTYCWHWRVSSTRSIDVVSCDEGENY